MGVVEMAGDWKLEVYMYKSGCVHVTLVVLGITLVTVVVWHREAGA